MKTKGLGWISLVTLFSITLWFILLIWDMATAGPLESIEQVLAHAGKGNWKFTVTYLNAGWFTICVIALMGGLFGYCRPFNYEWSLVGLVFVPVYGSLNLLCYLSQITLVPALIESTSDPVFSDTSIFLLKHTLQILPGSTVGFFNGLAYAILGIPSIIFGWTLSTDGSRPLQISGWLLTLNGMLCFIGVVGNSIEHEILTLGTVIGGVLFWLALFPMTYVFLTNQND
jgi:hypothetical protein